MQFKGTIDPQTAKRVANCDTYLNDRARLAALARSGMVDTPREEAFDRLAELAAQLLNVPLTIVSLVRDDKQFFKAGFGLPSPFDVQREVPITSSICRYTLAGEPIISDDAANDPLLMFHPTTEPWGIGAFVALPMITTDGHVLGAFCAVDPKPRHWTERDIFVMKSLTQSVMTEIALRERIEELEAERELRDRFVATLTHDLRTPLGVAKMSAEVLSDHDLSPAERAKILRMISENMDRADLMIRDLLDASRMKAGESLLIDVQAADLHQIAQATLANLRGLHGERFDFVSDGSVAGEFDTNAVRRIIENLATNAIKYGEMNSRVRVVLLQTENGPELSVHNQGNPISLEDQHTIFNAHSRTASARKQTGWGLGLTLVRGLVEAHSGSVSVESSLAAGTTFRVAFPRPMSHTTN